MALQMAMADATRAASKKPGSGREGGEAMSINDLPAIMGTVLIVAGLSLVGVSTWSRADGVKSPLRPGTHHCGRRIPLGAVDIRFAWKIELRSAHGGQLAAVFV
jgi:hypothetical protein